MKKLLTLAMVIVTSMAFAQGVPSPSSPRLMVDKTGNLLSSATPIIIDPYGPVTASSTVFLGTSTVIIALANRRHLTIISSEAFSFSVGSTTVPANMPQVLSVDMDIGPEVLVGIALATSSYVGIHQYAR